MKSFCWAGEGYASDKDVMYHSPISTYVSETSLPQMEKNEPRLKIKAAIRVRYAEEIVKRHQQRHIRHNLCRGPYDAYEDTRGRQLCLVELYRCIRMSRVELGRRNAPH